LTRPALDTIYRYRDYVDRAIDELLRSAVAMPVREMIELGCHHEQQHQELLLTDILHLFAQHPSQPAYLPPTPTPVDTAPPTAMGYRSYPGGIVEIGHGGGSFAFDSEGPRHRVILEPFGLADRLVTNGEWLEFMADDGYRNPLLWLSEGWARVLDQDWKMPLYWRELDGSDGTMTLHGAQPLELNAPVAHLSYFEADAFATWRGERLPTEAEWEFAARELPLAGNFADSRQFRPIPASGTDGSLRQMFGDVWEWTRSAFAPYPGFRPAAGAVGEYNGKFMSGQYVLRGGSCVTPPGHIRASYRNFFAPDARWQFSGLRLAKDE
jgi:ergothioneine biosynthesis protein EgtB